METNTNGSVGGEGIRIYTQNLSRIEPGQPVIVDYRSNRAANNRKRKSGQILSVDPLTDAIYKLWLYDPVADRKLEVVIRETVETSCVRSQKTDTATTIGSPVRVVTASESDNPDELNQKFILETRNGQCECVVAAAEIVYNEHIIGAVAQPGESQ